MVQGGSGMSGRHVGRRYVVGHGVVPPLDCNERYTQKMRTGGIEAAVEITSHTDVMGRRWLRLMERVRERVKDAVANGGIID